MDEHDEDAYTITGVVPTNQVPTWARRPPKWKRLIEAISGLKPGQSLTVVFESHAAANRARNTVRDNLNLTEGSAVFRTRIMDQEDGKAVVFFSRLHPYEVVEQTRENE